MRRIENYGTDIFEDMKTLGGLILIFALGWFSHELDMAKDAPTTVVASDVGSPNNLFELESWKPHRIEAVYESGLTVVSSLGPHGNFQYVVPDLHLPVGTTFRKFNGSIMEVM